MAHRIEGNALLTLMAALRTGLTFSAPALTRKGWIVGLLLTLSQPCSLPASGLSLLENDGFCAGGGVTPAPFQTWGSYCGKGDADVGHLATSIFRLSGSFDIYLAGDPTGKGLDLRLENLSDHQSLHVRPDQPPGNVWQKFEFEIPDSWRGKDLRLAAQDHSTALLGWLAFSAPSIPDKAESSKDAKKILLKTLLFTMLIFLPGFTLSLFAVSRGVRGTVKLGLVTLAGLAIPGYLVFFVYVLSAKAGDIVSAVFPYLSGAISVLLLFRMPRGNRRLLRPLLIPLATILFASTGVLSLGYLYGGMSTPKDTPANRFSHPLPPDNRIPFVFAESLRVGPAPRPLDSDWLSSDRPPLQTGMILSLERWVKGREIFYHVASVVMQSLWIFPVWLLLQAFRIPRVTTALVIGTTYLSGFTIVNTFFVWPKLLAAAYMVGFAIPLLTARLQTRRGRWLLRWLMAFLLACGLLAHGGSVFALLGLVIFMLVRFRATMLKETCILGAMTMLLYSPWVAYQKLVDPPGDRLLKFHLAGVLQVTPEPALQTIYDSYHKETFEQWISSKRANVETAFGHEIEFLKIVPEFSEPQSKRQLHALEFFFFMPTLGFTGFGIVCLLLRWSKSRKRNEMRAAERLLLWSFATTIPWIVLMFIPHSTIVHQGAYAMVLMAMAGSILAFRAVAPRLALVVCLIQCIFQWMIYAPDLAQAAFPFSLAQATNHWMMALHITSLVGFSISLGFAAVTICSAGRPGRMYVWNPKITVSPPDLHGSRSAPW